MSLRTEYAEGMREYNKAMIRGGPYIFAGCAAVMAGLVLLFLVMGEADAALWLAAMTLGLAAVFALVVKLGAKNRRRLLGDEPDPYERFTGSS